MKNSNFTDSQIVSILKQNEAGIKIPDLCCETELVALNFINAS